MNGESSVTQRKARGWSTGLILGITVLASLMTYASISADNAPKVAPAKSAGLAASSRGVGSGVPLKINHQGVVQVGGVRFNGTGLFRFAIVDPDTGNYLWTNDGSVVTPPAAPTAAVSVTGITNGVYSVNLGDAALTNMTTISSTLFSDDNLVLRIWFDDGPGSFSVEQLTPDHALGTSPYTFRAARATDADTVGGLDVNAIITAASTIPSGAIIMWSGTLVTIPAGWVLCDGNNGTPDLRSRFVFGVDTAEDPGATGGSSSHKHDSPVGNSGVGGRLAHADGPPWFGSGATFSSTWQVAREGGVSGTVTALGTSTEGHLPPFFKLAFIMKI